MILFIKRFLQANKNHTLALNNQSYFHKYNTSAIKFLLSVLAHYILDNLVRWYKKHVSVIQHELGENWLTVIFRF
jgi:hypothetical protein